MEKIIVINIKYITIFFLSLFLPLNGVSQGILSSTKYNDIEKKGDDIVIGIKSMTMKIDTALLIPKNILYKIKGNANNYEKSEEFYKAIKSKAYERKLTKQLYNLTFVDNENIIISDTLRNGKSETSFLKYKDKIIRNIRIKKLNVFGSSFSDTIQKSGPWIEKVGNNLHINTRDKTIENNLLIKKGDKIDPYLLAENERIIRSLPFIKDARILVISEPDIVDSVDILVLTKDLWSIAVDTKIHKAATSYFNVYDANFFGFGNKLQNIISLKAKDRNIINYHQGLYEIENINGTFITGKIEYYNDDNIENYGIDIEKKFITPETKYAGGLFITRHNNLEKLNENNLLSSKERVIYDEQNLWIGKSYPLTSKNASSINRSRIILSAKVSRKNYLRCPDDNEDLKRKYYNNTSILSSIALVKRNFYTSNLIYNYGRTEDIPYGYLLQLTTGEDFGQYFKRVYTGIKLAKANIINKNGYYYSSIDFGGFIRNYTLEDGVFDFKVNYYSPLIKKKYYKLRNFVKINYITGIYRTTDDLININDRNGIRGLKSDSLKGFQRLSFNFESVAFTHLYFYGFRFSFFNFADIGLIGSNRTSIFNNKLYSGLGFGLRIRNENLIFKTFQIRFAYYPIVPEGINKTSIIFSGENTIKFEDLNVTCPAIVKF